MRKTLLLLLTAFSTVNAHCELREKSLEFSAGYRRDCLEWSFEDPSIKTLIARLPFMAGEGDELLVGLVEAILCENDIYKSRWKDLQMVNIGALAKAVTCSSLYGRLSGNWAWVVDGRYKPSGLFAGEREFGTSHRSVSGHSWDISGAFGGQIKVCDDDLSLCPLIGFAYNELSLKTGKGRFTNGLFDLLDQQIVCSGSAQSRYRNYFTGPYLGFDAQYAVNCNLAVYTSFEYHWALYRAKSSVSRHALVEPFNEEYLLESDHKARFHHYACGRGLFWNLGANYLFKECWIAGFKFSWVDWRTSKQARIHAYVNNDDEEIYAKDCKLKKVQWESYRLEITLEREF